MLQWDLAQSTHLYGDRLQFQLIVQLYNDKLFNPFLVSHEYTIVHQPIFKKVCLNICKYLIMLFFMFCCAIEEPKTCVNTTL